MKLFTSINIILTLLLSLNLQNLNAQAPPAIENKLTLPASWDISENWLHDYRENLTPYASITWINNAISDGAEMLTSSETKGIILLEVIENEDQLSAEELVEESSLGGNDMDLFASKEVKYNGLSATAEWLGTIGGEKVIVQKTCILSSDESQVISITSIVPADSFGHDNTHVFEISQYIANQFTLNDTGLLGQKK